MKQLILLILSVIALQGCSVYGGLTKCEGFDEAGTRCTSLLSNLEYSKQREQGITSVPEVNEEAKTPIPEVIWDYEQLDAQVKNDEFARLVLEKKIGMSETDPILRPAKTVKATIYPYSDGTKFYQLRHIWIKTHEEEWIVGSTMLVNAKGTVMMDKGATINVVDNNGDFNDRKATAATIETDTINGDGYNAGNGGNTDGGKDGETTARIDNTADNSSTEINTAEQQSALYQESTKNIGAYKVGDIVTINVLYLNVRKEPSAKSIIIGVIPAGGKLRILDETDGKWQRVRVVYYPKNQLIKEYDGWVHSDYLMAINHNTETWEDAL